MEHIVKNEPVLSVAFIGAGALAVITLLTEFGLELTKGQTSALLGVVSFAATIIVALVARTKVTPNAKVVETQEPDGTRIAGEASPLPTGTEIGHGSTAHDGF
jgi:hypothetical protein